MDSDSRRRQNVLIVNLLFPLEYGLFLVLSLLDLFITLVIVRLGGREVNPVADFFLREWGRTVFIVYKLVLVFFVIGLCEAVGGKNFYTVQAGG